MRKFACLFAAALLIFPVAALEVAKEEIRSADETLVQFQNYGGTHAVIESAAAITGIGTALGAQLADDVETERTLAPGAKYSIVHAVSPLETEKLDADILILSEQAGVDHITNLRRILSGFLQAAYSYGPEDAQALSVFITVYNAVYRGQLHTFSDKYKEVVIQNLSPEFSGLSTNWEEWAGKTWLVIPLRDPAGGLSAVDTTIISDENVVEALRKEDDKSIEPREQLTDLKERESKTAEERAQDAQREASQQRRENDREGAAQSARTSAEQQQLADRKRSESQNERQQQSRDREENAAQTQSQTEAWADAETGLFGADSNGLYTLMTVDSRNGRVLKNSPMKQIRGKAVFAVQNVTLTADGQTQTYPELFLAVCGVNSGNSAVRLCLLDTESLELKKEGAEILSEDSELVPFRDLFYVILETDGKSYVGAYDKSLSLKARSTTEVNPTTPFNITDAGLLVTGADGKARLLNLGDLSAIW